MLRVNLLSDEQKHARSCHQNLLMRQINDIIHRINERIVIILSLAPTVGFLTYKTVNHIHNNANHFWNQQDYTWLAINILAGLCAGFHMNYINQENKRVIKILHKVLSEKILLHHSERIQRLKKHKTVYSLMGRIQFIEEILGYIPGGVLYSDTNNKYIYVNKEACRIFGVSRDEIIGKKTEEIFQSDIIRDALEIDKQARNMREVSINHVYLEAEGERRNYLIRKTQRYNEKGGYIGMIAVIVDIDTLHKLSSTDFLTGLGNRRIFEEELNHRTRKIIRNPGEKIALLFIDLNKFKQVNTIHGHGTGDIVLKEIARIIHTHIREIDVAARIGGDEFAIIASDIKSIENAKQMAEKIIFDIQNATVFTSNGEIPLCGISIGISIFPNKFCEEESHSEILKIIYNQADVAMYKAKAKSEQSDAGINSIVLFDE